MGELWREFGVEFFGGVTAFLRKLSERHFKSGPRFSGG